MNVAHPHFAEPAWLWLAVLAPAALFALQRYSSWARKRQLAQIAAPSMVRELTKTHSPGRRHLKEILLVIALAAIGVALARPQWGEQTEGSQLLGRDTVFVLDCSRSMLASDVAPNRLERAKLAILDYVQHHGRGRVGLVAFSGQAFLQCPLTFDYGAFRDSLMAIDEKTIPIPGTDIGRALDEGFRAMEKGESEKIMVLLTDGEDLEKGGINMAENLAKKNLVVFTVGVGTPNGTEIQLLNDQGRMEPVRDRKGEVVLSRLDEPTLRRIAEVTHGSYFPLGPLGEGLAKVRLAAEQYSEASAGAAGRKLGVDRFHFPVALVLVVLVAETIIGTRRRPHPTPA